MAYTNSPLVSYTKISPNRTKNRKHPIDTITIHCVVGQCSVETIGNIFSPASRCASSNYGIGFDGRIGMYCEEKDRSWCSSNAANDQRAITIECASDTKEPYAFRPVVYDRLVELCVDICKRNNKTKLIWFGDKSTTLNYTPKPHEMVLTVHRWFANKSCPGNWMYARMGNLSAKVTVALESGANDPTTEQPATDKVQMYRVRKTWADTKSQIGAYKVLKNAQAAADKHTGYSVFDGEGKSVYPNSYGDEQPATFVPYLVNVIIGNLNIRKGPGINYGATGKFTGKGCFTIVEVQSGTGSDKGWGKLKSGVGWIALDYTTRI